LFLLCTLWSWAEPDLQLAFSRQMVQKVSGLAAGKLKHAFWLDLEHGDNQQASLSLNLALDFMDIPGEITIQGRRKRLNELLTPVCDRPGEIFAAQSCAASGMARPGRGVKLRVKLPMTAQFRAQEGDELHLLTLSAPAISASFDEDLNQYLSLLTEVAALDASLQALYSSDAPWAQLKPRVDAVSRELRQKQGLVTRFNARSTFFAIPDAATIRRLMAQARLQEQIAAAVSNSGARVSELALSDDLRVSLKINQISKVFAPYMPGVRLNHIEVQMVRREDSDPLPNLILKGVVQ